MREGLKQGPVLPIQQPKGLLRTEDRIMHPETPKKEFRNQTARVLNLYFQNGTFVPNPSTFHSPTEYPGYTIDVKKGIDTLEQLQKADPYRDTASQYEEMKDRDLQRLYGKMVRSFVQNGFLPESLVSDASKIFRAANIRKTRGDATHLTDITQTYRFADGPVRPTTMYIAEEIAHEVDSLRTSLQKFGVTNLSEEQIQECVIRQVLSHEYGHVLHRTIAISLANRFLERQRKSDSNFIEPDEANYQHFVRQVEMSIFEAVYQEIAPDEQLQKIFAGEPTEGLRQSVFTSQERIAMGLEYIGLQFALEEKGVSGDVIEKIFAQRTAEHNQNFAELEAICQTVKEQQCSLNGLSYATVLLGNEIEKAGRSDLLGYHPAMISTAIGYEVPLIVDELLGVIGHYEQA